MSLRGKLLSLEFVDYGVSYPRVRQAPLCFAVRSDTICGEDGTSRVFVCQSSPTLALCSSVSTLLRLPGADPVRTPVSVVGVQLSEVCY